MRERALRRRLAHLLGLARQTAHLMVGLPDYDRYVAHQSLRHPGEPVMGRAQFVRNRAARRFAGAPDRCC